MKQHELIRKRKPKRHIVILGGQAYQEADPLPEKTEGMEFWAQNPIEQWIRPKISFAGGWDYRDGERIESDEVDNIAMLAEVVDRWYEIHKPELTAERHPKHLDWLCGTDIVVYAQEGAWMDRDINAATYPIEEVQALAPHANYLGGTFSYMVAHAILEKADKISFHWMSKPVVRSSYEPRDATASLAYWLGMAEARGIEVDCGGLWLLCSWWGGRYGYDGMPPEWHSDDAERKYQDYLADGPKYGWRLRGED